MLVINLIHFFIFIFIFFVVNLLFLIASFNYLILILIFLDILVLANIILFIFYTLITYNSSGYSFAVLCLVIAAAETTIGLGLFILYYKSTGKTSIINNC